MVQFAVNECGLFRVRKLQTRCKQYVGNFRTVRGNSRRIVYNRFIVLIHRLPGICSACGVGLRSLLCEDSALHV